VQRTILRGTARQDSPYRGTVDLKLAANLGLADDGSMYFPDFRSVDGGSGWPAFPFSRVRERPAPVRSRRISISNFAKIASSPHRPVLHRQHLLIVGGNASVNFSETLSTGLRYWQKLVPILPIGKPFYGLHITLASVNPFSA
jgi:hypothetical protein